MASVKSREGVVRDATGNVLAGKTATLKNNASGATVTAGVTDANGKFSFTSLDETLTYRVEVAVGGGSAQKYVNAPSSPEVDHFYVNASLRTAAGATVAFGGDVSVAGALAGTITSTGGVVRSEGTSPRYEWFETDASANEKNWRLGVSGGVFYVQAINDAGAGSAMAWTMERTGNAVTNMKWYNGGSPFVTFNYANAAITFTGAVTASGLTTGTGVLGRFASGSYVGGQPDGTNIITLGFLPQRMTIMQGGLSVMWDLFKNGSAGGGIYHHGTGHTDVTGLLGINNSIAAVLRLGNPASPQFANTAGNTYYWFAWG